MKKKTIYTLLCTAVAAQAATWAADDSAQTPNFKAERSKFYSDVTPNSRALYVELDLQEMRAKRGEEVARQLFLDAETQKIKEEGQEQLQKVQAEHAELLKQLDDMQLGSTATAQELQTLRDNLAHVKDEMEKVGQEKVVLEQEKVKLEQEIAQSNDKRKENTERALQTARSLATQLQAKQGQEAQLRIKIKELEETLAQKTELVRVMDEQRQEIAQKIGQTKEESPRQEQKIHSPVVTAEPSAVVNPEAAKPAEVKSEVAKPEAAKPAKKTLKKLDIGADGE